MSEELKGPNKKVLSDFLDFMAVERLDRICSGFGRVDLLDFWIILARVVFSLVRMGEGVGENVYETHLEHRCT